MKARAAMRALTLALVAAFAATIPSSWAHSHESSPAIPSDAARELLVMLHMPPPHYRPNARYGGSYGDAAAQTARRRVAQQIANEHGLELLEGWPMPLIGVDCFVMRVPKGLPMDEIVARVSQHDMVAWAQPQQVYRTRAGTDGDPLYPVQPAAAEWKLADLHEVATGRGVTVAVIDSRIEVRHPDLAGQFVTSRDFVSDRPGRAEEHGTAIAGVIAAKSGNGVGIVGVAPDAKLMALRACFQKPGDRDESGTCATLAVAKALHYALDRSADIVNLSLSGPPDPLLESLIKVGLARKISFVAAFDPSLPGGGFPASQPGVVASAGESLRSAPPRVYLAPGRDVPTTKPGGRWYLVDGNSFAAAHVSGLLALLHEKRGSAASPARIVRSPSGAINACATLLPKNGRCR